ncbi:GGDEF domain-containing protein [Halodesulfovibrio sp.]|jgi:diguanylate cyclase (GGDEF)-like protein|uniref:GGDEF domain-containing protein n=1 Tax=Halodesulfovibrio sp. TaxID=1912772 RepID=UPI0025D47521|nr:GGDEF domain-containing protein [Halodesulfovibrio sp.]MCT4533939.1 GGDEF domain-containing protein [Halodesulfovibrio sp.]MCT4627922.1 GGDEF domain-containing protein [Halodesulfovibrio sp.]
MQKRLHNLRSESLENLATELDTLRRLIADSAPFPNGEQQLALTRIVSGLTVDGWNELSEAYGFSDWLALTLDSSSSFELAHLQRVLDELTHRSERDPLTGLYNKQAFESKLSMELQRVERSNGQLSLAIIDLDNFKNINDTYGHNCGDEVIKTLADLLDASTRSYDHAARIGGEEFALLLPGAGPIRAKAMLDRLCRMFADTCIKCNNVTIQCSFSAGVASLKGRSKASGKDLFEVADKALYQAKNAGKNQVHVTRQLIEFEYDRSTMVHSNEKQFLFSGSK